MDQSFLHKLAAAGGFVALGVLWAVLYLAVDRLVTRHFGGKRHGPQRFPGRDGRRIPTQGSESDPPSEDDSQSFAA